MNLRNRFFHGIFCISESYKLSDSYYLSLIIMNAYKYKYLKVTYKFHLSWVLASTNRTIINCQNIYTMLQIKQHSSIMWVATPRELLPVINFYEVSGRPSKKWLHYEKIKILSVPTSDDTIPLHSSFFYKDKKKV